MLGTGCDGCVLSLADLILSARIALQVVAGNSSPAELRDAGVVEMDRRGRFERIDFAAHRVGRHHGRDLLRRLHGASKTCSRRKLRLYYANYNLFVFSMLAIPVLADPTLVWIVVELTTLCSALLVSFENTREALEAAWKYVVLSLMGAGMALFGFLVLFAAMQRRAAAEPTPGRGLVAAAPRMPPILLQTAFLLILIGLGTKVGLVPMHTWLPDAHSQAPIAGVRAALRHRNHLHTLRDSAAVSGDARPSPALTPKPGRWSSA